MAHARFPTSETFSTRDTSASALALPGHTRIALLTATAPHRSVFTQARRPYGELLATTPPAIIERPSIRTRPRGLRACLLERGVTAIITGSSLRSLGAIRTISSLGLSVPDDVFRYRFRRHVPRGATWIQLSRRFTSPFSPSSLRGARPLQALNTVDYLHARRLRLFARI